MKLAFNVSELTFLKAKQQIIEDRLQTANERNECHAVIEVNNKCFRNDFFNNLFQHLSDDLNAVQTEMMNKISDVQELKLVLNSLRTDHGSDLNTDLEQVTIELKLDEVVRQHIIKLKQQSIISAQDDEISNELTFEQALTEAISSTGMKRHREREKTSKRNLFSHRICLTTFFLLSPSLPLSRLLFVFKTSFSN